jgi:hypothetical protein
MHAERSKQVTVLDVTRNIAVRQLGSRNWKARAGSSWPVKPLPNK